MNFILKYFEILLNSTRFIIIISTIFSILGAISLFIVASFDIYEVFIEIINSYLSHATHKDLFHEKIIVGLISSIDLYLMGIVMFIFGFGTYELFISKIENRNLNKTLVINSLDELKDKLAKVIIMVLIVSFFKQVLYTSFNGALEILYFVISIFVLSLSVYILKKEKT